MPQLIASQLNAEDDEGQLCVVVIVFLSQTREVKKFPQQAATVFVFLPTLRFGSVEE